MFVFGSNLAGRHGKGAALTARKEYGAVLGKGSGLMGGLDDKFCYAIPTKDERLQQLPLEIISVYVDSFSSFTQGMDNTMFTITRVGCGLAGHKDSQIAPMFGYVNKDNCFFDTAWREYLGDEFMYWGTY